MLELYELVKAGKERQKIASDRGYAIANNINPQVIVDLKAGKSMPNAENMLKILAAANLDVNDGIKAIERQKEAGFTSLDFMASIATFSGMSLAGMHPSPEALALTGLAASAYWGIYIMRSEGLNEIRICSQVKTQLFCGRIHEFKHLIASNDVIAA